MASSSSLILTLSILLISSCSEKLVKGCYTSIFSFGNSLTDTGNLYQSFLNSDTKVPYNVFFSPYGESFFHTPTGRACNGRLIIDFIAESFGLPFLPPYLKVKKSEKALTVDDDDDFKWGVNFAVVGATALNNSFFKERGIDTGFTDNSLHVQLGWFKDYLSSLCHTFPDCREFLQNSLFVLGEIGGNDYNNPYFMKRSREEVQSFIPLVIDTITEAIKELLKLGATKIIVPGDVPIGCLPSYLTLYQSSNKEDYDPLTGCIAWINNFAEEHNQRLQNQLARIQDQNPHAKIAYADYYNPALNLYLNPKRFGFGNEVLKSCCGGGGPYNYNSTSECGSDLATVCDDPSLYISWDGLHMTEAAYKYIAEALLEELPCFQELSFST